MIFGFSSNYIDYSFVREELLNPDLNVFTVIVGKNGTGKSRLLRKVIEEIFSVDFEDYKFDKEPARSITSKLDGELRWSYSPTKVIAVSVSPFDKFPIIRRNYVSDKYTYLGVRDSNGSNLGLAYMGKIINSLIYSIICTPGKAESIGDVLNYLGYFDNLNAHFKLSFSFPQMNEIVNAADPEVELIKILSSESSIQHKAIDRRFYFDSSGSPILSNFTETVEIFKVILDSISRPIIEVEISRNGIAISDSFIPMRNQIIFMFRSGMLRLRDVVLCRLDSHETIKIHEASSGEQSVVMSILGIASQIQDGSLICIDEPEICLHPEWQEKYIDLVVKTFQNYRGCQFIIATHSPLIVSRLGDENCFLMPMENGSAISASLINKRSVDFQLASTFKTPGFRNEYLTRELVSILAYYGENGQLKEGMSEKIKIILSLKDKIDNSDPVSQLMRIAEEAIKG